MKYSYYFAILSFLLISCESKIPIEVKQIESQGMVKILPNPENSLMKDSIIISIPTEFEIKINSSVRCMTWHYVGDGKTLWNDAFDYLIYKAPLLHQFDISKIFFQNPTKVIKKERNHFISKSDAIGLLKKYNIDRSIDHLKFGESIKLTSYDKFKRENKVMIHDFRKINDSINFRVMKEDGRFFYLHRKINW